MHIGIQSILVLVLQIGIACAVAWAIVWFIDWMGVIPEPLAKILKIIVVAVIGVWCIIRLLSFAGIS